MKRSLAIPVLLAALLTLSAACSAPMSENAIPADSPDRQRTSNLQGNSYIFSNMDSAAGDSFSPPTTTAVENNRKIIWNASLDIEAEDAAALHWLLASRAAALGGYEHTNNIQNYERHSVVIATYKIPPQHIHAFIAYAGEEGKVINSRLGSEDITESYFDSAQRLETKRSTLEPYYRLMAEAKDIDEIVRIQRIIDGITEEIEALEGRLRVWGALTEMATVDVFIRQENDPISIRREISWNTMTTDDMGYLIKIGFTAVTGTALTILQWIAVVLLVTSPLWVIGLAVWWVWRRFLKKHVRIKRPESPVDNSAVSDEDKTEKTGE
jgi:hypothetical protein